MSLAAPSHDGLSLRRITLADAVACHRLSQAVSWPHRVEDWQMVIGLGHGVVVTDGEAVVATALWWPYGEDYATLGMIIVEPGRQGGGIGKRLMQGLFDQVGDRTLMLNATEAGEPLYAKGGFVRYGEVRQYHGEVPAAPAPVMSEGERLRPATADDLPILLALDAQATGLPRRPVLEALLSLGDCVVLEREGVAIGFSILRVFGRGHLIGPVVAPGEAEARILIAHWLHARGGGFLRIDIPAQTELDDWLVGHGLKPAGEVVGMVRGQKPMASGPARLYALVNQALG